MQSQKKRILLTLFFGLSFFLPVHLMWFYSAPAWYPLRCYLNSIPLILFLLIPAFFPKQIAKPWLVIFYCVFLVPTVCGGMHLLFYQTTISSHSFFAIFGTSIDEATEFIVSQLGPFALAYFALLIFLPLWPLTYLLRMPFAFGKQEKYSIAVIFTLVSTLFLTFGTHRLTRDHQGFIMAKSLINYYEVTRSLAEYMNNSRNLVANNVADDLNDVPRTIVVAIGESSNRHHWSLYGYPRPTTPKLDALKPELLVFTDAISPFANTMASVPCALSYIDPSDNKMIPLMTAFKQVGFETVWISNQNTVDTFNPIVQMVFGADQQRYLNKGGNQRYARALDENLISSLRDILSVPAKNKKRVVFLHMMGSHVNYAARIPHEFKHFSSKEDIPVRPWRNSRALSYINDYDNTILYTDTVLAGLIAEMKRIPNSCLLYFSDHGEEVFDTLPQYGHEHRLNSRHYLDIPFFLWLSSSYRQALPAHFVSRLEKAKNEQFMNDIAGNIIAKLAGVSLPCEESRNPISSHFKPFKRMPYGIDYDNVFNGTKGIEEPVKIQ